MAKKTNREIVGMVCTVCKSRNYMTDRNKINMENVKLVLSKYCKKCGKYTEHKETDKLK